MDDNHSDYSFESNEVALLVEDDDIILLPRIISANIFMDLEEKLRQYQQQQQLNAKKATALSSIISTVNSDEFIILSLFDLLILLINRTSGKKKDEKINLKVYNL